MSIVRVVTLSEYEATALKNLNAAFDKAEKELRHYEDYLKKNYATGYTGITATFSPENEHIVYHELYHDDMI